MDRLSQEPERAGGGSTLHHQWPHQQFGWWLHEVLRQISLMGERQALEPGRGEWKAGELLSKSDVLVRSLDGAGIQA